jgi:hypothetical protein
LTVGVAKELTHRVQARGDARHNGERGSMKRNSRLAVVAAALLGGGVLVALPSPAEALMATVSFNGVTTTATITAVAWPNSRTLDTSPIGAVVATRRVKLTLVSRGVYRLAPPCRPATWKRTVQQPSNFRR